MSDDKLITYLITIKITYALYIHLVCPAWFVSVCDFIEWKCLKEMKNSICTKPCRSFLNIQTHWHKRPLKYIYPASNICVFQINMNFYTYSV